MALLYLDDGIVNNKHLFEKIVLASQPGLTEIDSIGMRGIRVYRADIEPFGNNEAVIARFTDVDGGGIAFTHFTNKFRKNSHVSNEH
jgi:hypothetical protein